MWGYYHKSVEIRYTLLPSCRQYVVRARRCLQEPFSSDCLGKAFKFQSSGNEICEVLGLLRLVPQTLNTDSPLVLSSIPLALVPCPELHCQKPQPCSLTLRPRFPLKITGAAWQSRTWPKGLQGVGSKGAGFGLGSKDGLVELLMGVVAFWNGHELLYGLHRLHQDACHFHCR